MLALILFLCSLAFAIDLICFEKKERERHKAWREAHDKTVKDINEGFAKLNTACELIKQGYVPPSGELIKEIGVDYVVTQNAAGKESVTILGNHRLH
jgi:hypothetical protein